MSKEEVLITPYAEMMDMLACSAIDAGASQKKKKLTMEEILFEVR